MSRAVRAIQRKFNVMRGLGAIWPAALRGGKLLARGRFIEFGRKLFSESPAETRCFVRSGPSLFLAGHVLGTGGYDQVVLAVLKGLHAAGVNVCRDAGATFRPEQVPSALQPIEAKRAGEARLTIIPPHLLHRFKPEGRTAVLTMWETDTLPTEAVKHLNAAALVMVPSEWGARCFRRNGVEVPIEVVPLGHDPEWFHPRKREEAHAFCTFGTAGALDEGGIRKKVQRVIELFRLAFPCENDVRLRVKITPASPMVQTHNDARIEVIRESLSVAALAEWYRSLTTFVNASCGEGFGLHLLEAMACGRPLISTAFGGPTAFFDGSVGYPIRHRLVEARTGPYRGHWAEPDEQEMIAAMRCVAANAAEAAHLGQAASRQAAHFTWEDTVRKLIIMLIRHRLISPARVDRCA